MFLITVLHITSASTATNERTLPANNVLEIDVDMVPVLYFLLVAQYQSEPLRRSFGVRPHKGRYYVVESQRISRQARLGVFSGTESIVFSVRKGEGQPYMAESNSEQSEGRKEEKLNCPQLCTTCREKDRGKCLACCM